MDLLATAQGEPHDFFESVKIKCTGVGLVSSWRRAPAQRLNAGVNELVFLGVDHHEKLVRKVLPHVGNLVQGRVNLVCCAAILQEDADSSRNALQLEAGAEEGRSGAVDESLNQVLVAFDDREVKHDLGALIADDHG
jgi:hypothetical protein